MTADPRTVIRDKVARAIADADHQAKFISYFDLADAATSAHLEALEQAARIETDRVGRVRAICQGALTDYVDEGEPVLAQYILDTLDAEES